MQAQLFTVSFSCTAKEPKSQQLKSDIEKWVEEFEHLDQKQPVYDKYSKQHTAPLGDHDHGETHKKHQHSMFLPMAIGRKNHTHTHHENLKLPKHIRHGLANLQKSIFELIKQQKMLQDAMNVARLKACFFFSFILLFLTK